ncbi:MAG: EamA family transporter [Candidatus Paceibacterota bacterium]
MFVHLGIALAFVAMLCWGFGDFFIQKSTRKVGDFESLFFITAFGAVILLPFAYKNLPAVFSGSYNNLLILGILCAVLFFAAILDFEALRVGKLSVVEPIWSFEVPVSALLAFFILGEKIGFAQILLIIFLLFGLALVSLRNKFQIRKLFWEKGALIAFFGAVMMGVANFYMGWGSRISDPVMANFISDLFIAIVCGVVLIARGKFKQTIRDIFSNKAILLPMSIADKAAWLAFAFAMSLAPIAIVVALSESYIIIAVILGLAINKEKLHSHQKFGLIVAVFSAIILASITG